MSAGTHFGKYFLIKRLAQGGMGEIYIARQQGPGGFSKTVALKKILPHLTDNKEFIQGFLGEAALSAKMTHRNIVSVFDFGLDEESNSYFLTMEYVSGKALNQVLEECNKRRERMPVALIREVAIQMCEGMSYAHNLTGDMGESLNLVHRDLNPSNLLVSYNGDVKIIDWGIAKSEMSQVKTEAGMIKGKFVYMSPEQSMAKRLDKRSDVFAAGITLYEMLTGENPFHKPNVVLSLEAIQRLDPSPPSEFDPSLAGFDQIVAKALAKDPAKRYQDCADMAEDLKSVMVPPAGERLGQFVGRLFRASLEEEQRLMQDTGAARLAGARAAAGSNVASNPGARPPTSNPGARPPTSNPGARPSSPPEERGGTLVIGDDEGAQDELRRQMEAAKAKLAQQGRRSSPPTPPPAPAPSAERTMFLTADGQEVPPPGSHPPAAHHAPEPAPSAERTMFLNANDVQPPPPPPRRSVPPAPVAHAQAPEGAQSTMFIGAADLQPPPPKRSASGLIVGLGIGTVLGVVAVGAFFILNKNDTATAAPNVAPTPPPAPAAVAEPKAPEPKPAAPPEPAAAPAEAATTPPPPPTPPAGAPVAAPSTPPPAGAAVAPKTADLAKPLPPPVALPPPVPLPAAPKPAAPKPVAPAPVAPAAPKPAAAPPAPPAAAPVVSKGWMLLAVTPSMPVKLDGKPQAAPRIEFKKDAGSITIGEDGGDLKITIAYKISGGALSAEISTEPWSILSVGDAPRGKTPQTIELDGMTSVGFKRPGVASLPSLKLRYSP